jgi:phosphoribosyl-ATP pyrophosphohydrolase
MSDALTRLAETIESRRGASADASYTAKLLAQGREKCAKKFGEESVELALAAMGSDKNHITAEAADVLYHLLVVLAASGVTLADVMAELARREGMSGIVEKASRGATE